MRKNNKYHTQEQMRFLAAILFLLIFLPILGVVVFSGRTSLKYTKESELEYLLPLLVYQELPDNSQEELICAQAVLVRSRIYLRWESAENPAEVYQELTRENIAYERDYKLDPGKFSKCKDAVEKTRGCVLSYGGKVVEGPYCRASNGWTRAGAEVLGKENYGWLAAVECKEDLDYGAEEVPQSFTASELYEKLKAVTASDGLIQEGIVESISVASKDSYGYAMEVNAGGIVMSGEAFRKALSLPSASFTIGRDGDNLTIACRGLGHGMGLSQYSGNRMAEEGTDFRMILNHFFPNAQIIEISFE